MKVFLVWYTDHFDKSNLQVVEVFSTEEKARQYVDLQSNFDYYFEEREVK